jgi:hypothetical protein
MDGAGLAVRVVLIAEGIPHDVGRLAGNVT